MYSVYSCRDCELRTEKSTLMPSFSRLQQSNQESEEKTTESKLGRAHEQYMTCFATERISLQPETRYRWAVLRGPGRLLLEIDIAKISSQAPCLHSVQVLFDERAVHLASALVASRKPSTRRQA